LGDELYLCSYSFIDHEHWQKGFDDSLKIGAEIEWSKVMVLKSDVAKIWPFSASAHHQDSSPSIRTGAPGRPTPMHLIVAEHRKRLASGKAEMNVTAESERLATRAAVVRDSSTVSGIGQLAAIQAVAPSLGIELTPLDVRDESELERAVALFARKPNGGIIITASPTARINRQQVIALVAQHRLPTVYPFRYFVSDGGLVCYGPNIIEQFRLAADYVSRILKGERPAEMPVQAPTKYELLINLKTAKALDLTVPPTLLARADEVIE